MYSKKKNKKKKKKVQSQCVSYGFISSTYVKELKKTGIAVAEEFFLKVLKQLHTVGF